MKESRLEREQRTIRAMIDIFCRAHHGAPTDSRLCDDCQQLYRYSLQRVDKCPHQEDKPPCARCPIHCYTPTMRARIRQVMRFSGPRMLIFHPWLTLLHYIDALLDALSRKKR